MTDSGSRLCTPPRPATAPRTRRAVPALHGMLLALASIFGSAVFFGSAVHSVAARAQVAAPSRSAPGDLAMTVTEAAVPLRAEDVLRVAAPGAVRLDGWIGEAIEATIRRRVMVQDVERIVGPFRERTEEHGGHWRCEYWGKWFTSAALAAAYQPTDDHGATLRRAADALIATQTPDGYIGTYRDGKRLEAWDVWGRKYVLLGLLADHQLTGDESTLAAATRQADLLLTEAAPGSVALVDLGLEVVGGLPPASILEPLALLYQRTGDRRYLAYCERIMADWSRPGAFSPTGPRLIENALEDVPPSRMGSRKAYEMMSCFEGVCEMYRISGEQRFLDAVVAFARSLQRREMMVHGSGSNQELWCDGTRLQTGILEQPVETCVTVTWMKLCCQLLRLTGDPTWADALEVALYNALLGSVTPDGAWWAYFSPLLGQRVPSHYQHADMELSCCVANGPRGLLLTPQWAVMGHSEGPVVNLFEQGSFEARLADGTAVTIDQETTYPRGDTVVLTVSPERPCRFSLRLRIPAWSRNTALSVDGRPMVAEAGRYAVIDRDWSAGDRVELRLDLRGRAVPAPSGAPEFAVMRGPVLLALDDRLVEPRDVAVWLAAGEDGLVDLQPVTGTAEVRLAFGVPFDVRPKHYFGHHRITLPMCDYASAGNGWSSRNLFRSWLPQPLFLRTAYPADTWRLTCPDITDDVCPGVPTATSVVAGIPPATRAVDSAVLRPIGEWTVEVQADLGGRVARATLEVPPPLPVEVAAERIDALAEWDDRPGWARPKIPGLVDGICSARFLLDGHSVVVRAGREPASSVFERGTDYQFDTEWGGIGRLAGGSIAAGQPVYVDYRFARRRIDSVVFTPEDRLELRVGKPHVAMPEPPAIAAGEVRVANIWLPENIRRLGPEHLFPIEEIAFPETPSRGPTEAESLLPRTLEKLRSGKPLRILAWGDSVTEGYLGDDQWQRQFVGRLQERFPVSKIELVTVGWGAHTSHDFLQAPSGHERNFEATVLARRPDLVISEFVNDSPLDPEAVRSDYLRVLEALRGIDAEWIILTPHYSIFTNPPAERDIDDDPRAYVKMLRAFGREHGVALADASLRYGRLWRQGIPYTTLMVNAANHPDARGMAIFADSLMALFP